MVLASGDENLGLYFNTVTFKSYKVLVERNKGL